MNNLNLLRASALSGLLCLSAIASGAPMTPMNNPSSAPAPNYLGASVGISEKTAFCDELLSCAEAARSWKVYSGVRLSDKILVEGGYIRFGEQQGTNSDNQNVRSATSGYTTAGVITYPLNDQIELFGKAGMLWWKQEQQSGETLVETSGNDVFFGAGASYDLGDNLGVRAEWERFEGLQQNLADQQPVDLISLGLTFSSL